MSTTSSTRTDVLRAYFARSTVLRPILTSLNGDNSWLISFPRPASERTATGKSYYHIVSDPWLTGPACTISSLMIWVKLKEDPWAKSVDHVEALVAEIEAVALEAHPNVSSASQQQQQKKKNDTNTNTNTNNNNNNKHGIDAIFVNCSYHDHMHEETLRTFNPDIPLFAVKEAASVISPWKHFATVTQTHDLDPKNPNWTALHPHGSLPTWLNVFRLTGHSVLNFATVIVWSHESTSTSHQGPEAHSETNHEALMFTPHGIHSTEASTQALLTKSEPPVRVTAMLSALHDSFAFGFRTTLGVMGGLALERLAKPKYWIPTHDGVMDYWGLVMWVGFVNDVPRSLESALVGEETGESRPNLTAVGNGELFVLE